MVTAREYCYVWGFVPTKREDFGGEGKLSLELKSCARLQTSDNNGGLFVLFFFHSCVK